MDNNSSLTDFERRFLALLDSFSGKKDLSVKNLEDIEGEFQRLIAESPTNYHLLFQYNEFRIANGSNLPKIRPKILIGGPYGIIYPNLHSRSLFEVADVVCLTCAQKPYPYSSALFCQPITHFFDILKKLPPGFTPDFFWDNQIEHKHFIPAGIEIAPFPIVASVCHSYVHQSIEHVCELFDLVLPISKFHGDLLRKKYPEKIIDLPFGLNWASFNGSLQPSFEDKTIDVSVTFSETNSPVFCNHRNRTIELMKKFKEKYGNRFSIEICSPLPQEKYFEVLKKSRITINVTGIHGPYNYRTVEAMCSGAMVFQYGWENDFFQNPFSELFVEAVHGVSFNFENFESKLLYYLENPEKTQNIAKAAYTYLNDNFSYKKLYTRLIDTVKNRKIHLPRDMKGHSGYHHLDMIYYYQNNDLIHFMTYSSLTTFSQDWIKWNNLMVRSSAGGEASLAYLLLVAVASDTVQTETANHWSLCSSCYRKAIASVSPEYAWIIQWNFLLLSLESGKAAKEDIENMINLLQKCDPVPFDEKEIIFKYDVNSDLYPCYKRSHPKAIEFIKLNMELMKVIDQPQERVLLYHQYALQASHYFLEIIMQNS